MRRRTSAISLEFSSLSRTSNSVTFNTVLCRRAGYGPPTCVKQSKANSDTLCQIVHSTRAQTTGESRSSRIVCRGLTLIIIFNNKSHDKLCAYKIIQNIISTVITCTVKSPESLLQLAILLKIAKVNLVILCEYILYAHRRKWCRVFRETEISFSDVYLSRRFSVKIIAKKRKFRFQKRATSPPRVFCKGIP